MFFKIKFRNKDHEMNLIFAIDFLHVFFLCLARNPPLRGNLYCEACQSGHY